MKKSIICLLACFVFISIQLKAQEISPAPVLTDKISIGIGIGQEHGGFGANLTAYPIKSIGIFGGLGYNMVGAGYNIGLKFRLIPAKPTATVTPYFVAMYGYNAVIKVSGASQFDKIFYGPTFGVGIDYKSYSKSKIYYSFGINVPIRGTEVDEYMDDLKTKHNVEFKTGLIPITFTIGFKYILK